MTVCVTVCVAGRGGVFRQGPEAYSGARELLSMKALLCCSWPLLTGAAITDVLCVGPGAVAQVQLSGESCAGDSRHQLIDRGIQPGPHSRRAVLCEVRLTDPLPPHCM